MIEKELKELAKKSYKADLERQILSNKKRMLEIEILKIELEIKKVELKSCTK